MALVRWTPATNGNRDLLTFHDEINRVFDDVFGNMRGPAMESVFRPALDISETEAAFVLQLDLPGIEQKDVKVSLVGDRLTIRGERRMESTSGKGDARRIERTYGTFERSVTLDAPVRSDKVKATYRNGVLEVRVPKAEEARVREIEVTSA